MRRRLPSLLAALLALAGAAPRARAWSGGPPADRVGLCGARPTCRDLGCHDSFGPSVATLALESGPAPTSYRAGELVRFVLSVLDPDPSRARFGFQLAAASGCPLGVPAGSLRPLEPLRTQVIAGSGGMEFLEHLCAPPFDYDHCGYVPSAPGVNAWLFEWTAPALPAGPVTFFWAVNSADGSADATGDFISLGEHTLVPACPGRIATLRAAKRFCDPGAPGEARAELSWDPLPDASGYRLYRTRDREALAAPGASGATPVAGACDPGEAAALTFYTAVGLCADGSEGPA